jgi:hypothetical protein
VRALAITGDPAEDTPASVRRFLAARRAETRLDYLLGNERELPPLWSELKLLPSLDTGRDALHSAPLRPRGRLGRDLARRRRSQRGEPTPRHPHRARRGRRNFGVIT